jgi:glucose/arabinose dehydrogenase
MAQTAIQLIPVASGLSSPVYVTSAHDGSKRLFIVEQTGTIEVMPPGATAPLPTPFLDISTKITVDFERGLLCLAFHPQFKTNGRFFVTYNSLSDGAMTVSEFKVSENNSNVAKTEEKIILTIPKISRFHNGSWLDFGPDGYLYITTGDDAFSFDPNNVVGTADGGFLRPAIAPIKTRLSAWRAITSRHSSNTIIWTAVAR